MKRMRTTRRMRMRKRKSQSRMSSGRDFAMSRASSLVWRWKKKKQKTWRRTEWIVWVKHSYNWNPKQKTTKRKKVAAIETMVLNVSCQGKMKSQL
jgi:hypothetical protein